MSTEHFPNVPAGLRDNDRPVEVTTIAEATFQDILDIGVGELAVRDATVIERIIEPGYDEFISRASKVSRRLRNLTPRGAERAKHSIFQDEFVPRIGAMNRQLYDQAADATAASRVLPYINPGLPPAVRASSRAQRRHIDVNGARAPRVSMNFTLFTADAQGWLWRLYPSDASPDEESVDTPLVAGGCVILGDSARTTTAQDDYHGPNAFPRTVSHEVVSPPSSWNYRGIKRTRLLVVA